MPHPPGLGHDRDQPARRARHPAARRRPADRGRRLARHAPAGHRRRRAAHRRRRRRASCRGTATPSARSRCAARGSPARYYGDPAPEKFDDGWLRTGDVGTVDADGFVQITDRAKDVIKSGGEWISSVELENALMAHPTVRRGRGHRRARRALGRAAAGVRRAASRARTSTADELRAFLAEPGRASGGCPNAGRFIDEVPKTSVGKFDKKLLRARQAAGALHVLETQ